MNDSAHPSLPELPPAEHEVTARHYSSGQTVRVRWTESRITSVESLPHLQTDVWIAPSLVDLQVNGYAGIDFQSDTVGAGDLLTATRRLRADGCGRFLLTLITDDWPRMLARLQHLRSLRAAEPELQRGIVGWHLEGPFLSAEPGFCGAHEPNWMIDPASRHVEELRQVAGSDPLLLTVAPERPNALAFIREATSCGMRISLGHTDASKETLVDAQRAGAIAFTHLGNGCPRALDRHDNILWRVLDMEGLAVSLIPDGTHVAPALFRVIHRQLSPGSVWYTTDAMAAAGAPPGCYTLGRLRLEVGPDQIVRLPGTRNFAGSALRPLDAISRAAAMLGTTWGKVWDRFCLIPATLMGLPSGLVPGAPAEFCLLRSGPKGRRLTLQAPPAGLQTGES